MKKPEVNYNREIVEWETEIPWPEGSFDEIIAQMRKLKEEYPYIIDPHVGPNWYGSECEYTVSGKSLESDQQHEQRIKREMKALAAWEEKNRKKSPEEKKAEEEERELYEKLKAKFG